MNSTIIATECLVTLAWNAEAGQYIVSNIYTDENFVFSCGAERNSVAAFDAFAFAVDRLKSESVDNEIALRLADMQLAERDDSGFAFTIIPA